MRNFDINMKGSQLIFSKSWSELPAEPAVTLPWESGCWRHIIGGKSLFNLKPATMKRPMPPPLFYESPATAQLPPEKKQRAQSVVATSWKQVVKSGVEDSWTEMRDSQFQIALKRWLDVLLQLPDSCSVVVQLRQVGDVSHQLRMLRDIFCRKAPQTLLKRCHSFLRFVHHLKLTGKSFPGSESDLYAYLCHLRDSGAATSNLQSIVQALNFAQHVVGLQELMTITMSRRCIGAVGTKNSGPKRQAHPFKVAEVMALHSALHDTFEDPWTRVFAGTVLFAIYSRSRWMDMQHAEFMEVDSDMTGAVSFVELHISVHKCQESTAFRNTFLTAVSPNYGVTNEPWIQVWLDIRQQLGINLSSGLPTLPAPNSEGAATKRPLGTDEMKQWLHMVLAAKGICLDGRRLTSHSCKCTVLSWLAKRGDDWADRMALGGHVSFMKSAIVYSRDAMARPLRLLESLLLDIRVGRFAPDETRSGRFKDISSDVAAHCMQSNEVSFQDGAGDLFSHHVEPSLSVPPEVVDLEADCNSEVKLEDQESSNSDSDAPTTSSSEDEEGAQYTGAARSMRLPTIPDTLKLIQHVKYKTLHLMEKQNFRIMLCGRTATEGRYEGASVARFDTPCCHWCWKHKKDYES